MNFNLLKLILKFIQQHAFITAFLACMCTIFMIRTGIQYTSTDSFCNSCHVHPHSTNSWKMGAHQDTQSGIVVHCVDCHLPPGGLAYFKEKASSGIRDIFSTLFKDVSRINWELKSRREYAVNYTYKKSCLHCHQNLFSRDLSKKGEDAHLYYEQQADQLRCINCHLEVGHYHEKAVEVVTLLDNNIKVIFTKPTVVDSCIDFTEKIPGTSVSFHMVAIPGGSFIIGSPESESYRDVDEGPRQTVQISPFWMGKTEVSWDEYDAFYNQTASEGRTEDQLASTQVNMEIDVITGPTPAYGNPDQGWGKGKLPAITMTHYAATKYCEWLSRITGKHYRLPTEAEWEYAARGNTEGAYFFDGDPKKYTQKRLWNRLFGADTSVINSYIIYAQNSDGKTRPPNKVQPNPYGLLHILGNVKEFCADWYSADAYTLYSNEEIVVDPTGPQSGKEYVIRGGSYKSDAEMVRVADRNLTQYDAWMLTDPQMPKSLWWYSDNNDVGFRVVCEYNKMK